MLNILNIRLYNIHQEVYLQGGAVFEIEYYETENGRCPVVEFLDSIDIKLAAKALEKIDLLEDLGTALRGPNCKHLKDGIYELRPRVGNNQVRILYFFVVGEKIVLTHGFVKKTQKTPQKEIRKAFQYRADYLTRVDENET